MPIIWSKDYALGIEEIDNQHKELVLIINRIEQVAVSDPDHPNFAEKVRGVLKDVRDYTVLHFSSEEVILKMFDYPDFVEHKAKHDKFVALVGNKKKIIEDSLKAKDNEKVIEELNAIFKFLGEWIIVHIQKSDFEYGEFLAKIKKKAAKGFFAGLFG